eukprot:TRINITY_DN29883_c0_g2_i1.p1 TRINITY_DN29883_c0_g2~~TRINITY_DN29883_c0_g2_i1.p1  ORF type:complete len:131 (-),score=29.34 TRINITY_DN29883_c0_g2_i1:558-950(-)
MVWNLQDEAWLLRICTLVAFVLGVLVSLACLGWAKIVTDIASMEHKVLTELRALKATNQRGSGSSGAALAATRAADPSRAAARQGAGSDYLFDEEGQDPYRNLRPVESQGYLQDQSGFAHAGRGRAKPGF